MDKKILILDIETTGFLKAGGKIVEIGAVELDLETGQITTMYNQVTYERGITLHEVQNSWIVANSDLTVNDIRHSKSLDKIKQEFQMLINCYPNGVTAFNNAFDFGFLEDRGFIFNKKLGCPMKLSTDLIKLPKKRGSGYKWPNVMEAHKYFFGDVGYIEKHRGADDAYHEAQIVFELYKLGIFTL
ncbi:MAG: 3'-5' exonuclease [Phycisphaerales bacterium]|nr:3'-5' exonuclease [Phycisphaerales bacterium]